MNNEPEKIKLEQAVLERAHSLLLRLYGAYSVDESQKDRPDAAINVARPHKRFGRDRKPIKVGIEITTVDPKEYLAYFNDKRFGQDLVNAQFEASLKDGVDPERINKYMKVPILDTFIYDGIKGKAEAHEAYKFSGSYGEIILLCYTDILNSDSAFIKRGLLEWSNYHASQSNYPFDKVLFLAKGSDSAIKVYDRRTPMRLQPPPYDFSDPWTMPSDMPMFLMDRTYNLNELYSRPPLIPPKEKKKKKA
ncbi:hypothetical protein [Pseudomonas sp. LB-090624]|uniref:hypothetical protein n=1 Tax=Pseudomonas sp. LB-090624 TaxID=2213079 RepID=UPI0011B807DA|nr:hypothetical protein [Pseudomonas sp. LB-090624]